MFLTANCPTAKNLHTVAFHCSQCQPGHGRQVRKGAYIHTYIYTIAYMYNHWIFIYTSNIHSCWTNRTQASMKYIVPCYSDCVALITNIEKRNYIPYIFQYIYLYMYTKNKYMHINIKYLFKYWIHTCLKMYFKTLRQNHSHNNLENIIW